MASLSSVFIAAHTTVWEGYHILPVLFLFLLFRKPNLGSPATDLAEIWHADEKSV